MANSHTALWTNDLCRELIRGGFAGQRPTVLFGGPISLGPATGGQASGRETGSDAAVLLFEPNAGAADWADAWFPGSPSLAQWLTSWLDRTGWWEEEVMTSEDSPSPHPGRTPDAARRLAASH